MRISLIAAVAENGIIGRSGTLPWRLSDDLRRFKQLTIGHTIIMGRRTWESIGRALPGRRTVVVSRNADFRTNIDGVATATSLDKALELAAAAGDEEAFIVGGAELYRESLSRANRLYLTRVCAAVDGDTSFPNIEWNNWQLVESEDHDANEKNEFAYRFETYDRR
nr:Dihydrofolate reductase [uncultured bacterium]